MPEHGATDQEARAIIGLSPHPDLHRASDIAPLPDALPTGLPPFDTALFDPGARFHPAAAAAMGVHLPHLLWVQAADGQRIANALAYALRANACPLIVWDAGQLPAAALLDRLRPLTRKGSSAFLLLTVGPVLLSTVRSLH